MRALQGARLRARVSRGWWHASRYAELSRRGRAYTGGAHGAEVGLALLERRTSEERRDSTVGLAAQKNKAATTSLRKKIVTTRPEKYCTIT
jgi:hypothetical protein